EAHFFGVHPRTGLIDYDAVRRLAHSIRPRMIIAGSSAYPRSIDYRQLATVAKEVEALLFADIAHVAGFVASGLMDNPMQYCDVVTTSTHKTLCGPRTGGLILARLEFGSAIDSALYPGLQAAPGGHIIAARAVLFEMVSHAPFKELMLHVLQLAKHLASALESHGVHLYTGGTDTHMDVAQLGDPPRRSGADINTALLAHGIVANTMSLPNTSKTKRSQLALRLGTTAMAIRGMSTSAIESVAQVIADLLSRGPGAAIDQNAARDIRSL